MTTRKPVAWNSVIDVDLETSREYNLSAESVSFTERVNTRLRMIDKHSLIWSMFMSPTMYAAVFLTKITQTI